MNYLSKLQSATPLFSSMTPKILLNAIEKKVVILVVSLFSGLALLCFFIYSSFKNRKAVEIKDKDRNINLGILDKNKKENKKVEIQQGKEEQENEKEGKIAVVGGPDEPKGQVQDQVSIGKEGVVASDQKSESTIGNSYETEDIEKVVEIFTKQNIDEATRVECERYFKGAMTRPSDKKIKEFYRIISEQPAILDMVINYSFQTLNSVFSQQVIDLFSLNLCEILISSYNATLFEKKHHEKIFVDLLQKILNRASSLGPGKIYQKIIDHLFKEIKPEELTKKIVDITQDPLNLIESLIKILDDEIKAKVVEAALPSFKDPEKLEKLYCMSYQFAIGFFTPEAIEILFQHWMKTLNEDEYLEKISQLIDRVVSDKSIDNIIAVEGVLAANPEIKLEKLIAKNNHDNFLIGDRPQRLLPYLSAFYAMRHYDDQSQSLASKIEEMKKAIDFTNPIKADGWSRDERTIFGSYLAKRCSDDQLKDIFNGLKGYTGLKQRLIEAFLITILRSKESGRIIRAFEAYWMNYEDIKEHYPNTEWVLLGEIKSENVLKAVYQSLTFFPQARKEAIINLLRNGEIYNNNGIQTHYKVDLLPDTINKIVG